MDTAVRSTLRRESGRIGDLAHLSTTFLSDSHANLIMNPETRHETEELHKLPPRTSIPASVGPEEAEGKSGLKSAASITSSLSVP